MRINVLVYIITYLLIYRSVFIPQDTIFSFITVKMKSLQQHRRSGRLCSVSSPSCARPTKRTSTRAPRSILTAPPPPLPRPPPSHPLCCPLPSESPHTPTLTKCGITSHGRTWVTSWWGLPAVLHFLFDLLIYLFIFLRLSQLNPSFFSYFLFCTLLRLSTQPSILPNPLFIMVLNGLSL